METGDELSLEFLKRFIAYARSHCAPRLSAEAATKLVSNYVRMRNPTHGTDPLDGVTDKRLSTHFCNCQSNVVGGRQARSAIPITVRQLEAIVRISESLAKMQLRPFATDVHVDEAIRLFRVSTQQAASTGSLAGLSSFSHIRLMFSFQALRDSHLLKIKKH
jgi:DNA replication licensing factor MCM5